MLDLHTLRQACLGYDPLHRITSETACGYDGMCDLLDAIGYEGPLKGMTAEDADFIRSQAEKNAPVLFLWELISLDCCLVVFAPR